MKETTSMTMPSCFRRWCDRFNDIFKTKTQKTRFGDYQDLGKISRNTPYLGVRGHSLPTISSGSA
mgnify:FL=1